MPKKRPLEDRLAETEDKLDKLKLEKTIKELKARVSRKRR